MRNRRVAPFLVAGVVLAACGDDDSAGSAVDTTAPVTAAPTTSALPAPTAPPADTSAVSALLTLDDLPAGWSAEPRDDDDEQDARMIQSISQCGGLDAALIGDEVLGDSKAASDEFNSPDGSANVSEKVGFAVDEDTALAAMTEIADPALADCYEQAVSENMARAVSSTDPADSLPEGMTFSDITMERVDLAGVAEPDDVVRYRATATIDYLDQQVPLYYGILFLRDGTVLSQLEFIGTGAEFPAELLEPIVATAQQKMAAIAV